MNNLKEYIQEKLVIDDTVKSLRKNTVNAGDECYMLELQLREEIGMYELQFSDTIFRITKLNHDEVHYKFYDKKANGNTRESDVLFTDNELDYAEINNNGFFEFSITSSGIKHSEIGLFVLKNDYLKIMKKIYPKLNPYEDYDFFSTVPKNERNFDELENYFEFSLSGIGIDKIKPKQTYKDLAEIFVNI